MKNHPAIFSGIIALSLIPMMARTVGAACQCTMQAYGTTPGKDLVIKDLSGSATDHGACLSMLLDQGLTWCKSHPLGTMSHCYSEMSTYRETCTEPPKPPAPKYSCIAYEHGWLNGRQVNMTANESVDLAGTSMNDEISSTWTAPNCQLAVYKHSRFREFLMRLGPGENKLLGIHDMITSMRCECK